MKKYYWLCLFYVAMDGKGFGFYPVTLENPEGDFLDLNSICAQVSKDNNFYSATVTNWKEISEEFHNKSLARMVSHMEAEQKYKKQQEDS